MERFED